MLHSSDRFDIFMCSLYFQCVIYVCCYSVLSICYLHVLFQCVIDVLSTCVVSACNCDPMGSTDLQCDAYGYCPCRPNIDGRRCDRCKENTYNMAAGCLRKSLFTCLTLVAVVVVNSS